MTKRTWGVVALLASLAVNVALIGFVLGATVRPTLAPRAHFNPTVGIGELLRHLPQERRAQVLAGVSENGKPWRRRIRASARDMRQAQRALHQALVAETLDEAALTTALGNFREHFATNQERSHAAFVAIASQLTPSERREFVASIKEDRRRPRPRRGAG